MSKGVRVICSFLKWWRTWESIHFYRLVGGGRRGGWCVLVLGGGGVGEWEGIPLHRAGSDSYENRLIKELEVSKKKRWSKGDLCPDLCPQRSHTRLRGKEPWEHKVTHTSITHPPEHAKHTRHLPPRYDMTRGRGGAVLPEQSVLWCSVCVGTCIWCMS